ncbi:MAG: Clp protease N-terminal domain-containing protein, partial [Myxococcota bacterium]
MNFDKLTHNVRDAVARAHALATEHQHSRVHPEHVFAALLEQRDGLVPRLLSLLDIDVRGLRMAMERAFGDMPSGASGQELRGSLDLEQLWRSSVVAADARDAEYLASEHLLLGMFDQGGVIARALDSAGLRREAVEVAMAQLRSGPPEVAPEPEQDASSALAKYTLDMAKQARDGEIDPVVGRDEEIR